MNENVKQAIIRVSDNVRHAINGCNNRLYFSMVSCRVYDQLYIKRCNKCQGFDHYAKNCSSVVCCGLCGTIGHETHNCPHKDKSNKASSYKCVNCSNSGKHTIDHPAYSSDCPSYRIKQEKLKASLSYYSKNV